MRPHFLKVTAFGAFAETVRVDFDDLAAGGLFLLHGETGAGKTTLLDALGFALYGRVPGTRWEAKRLRSDHAAAAAATSVCLEATLGGQRLRITRRPAQERAKKHGGGTTTEQASVLLERWNGTAWETLSSRVAEADLEIADRVGMTADQFFQVIMLPQGKFADFLRADSKDRAELLKKLFGTQRFADVERWLAERARRTGTELSAHLTEIDKAAALVAQHAEVEAPAGVPEAVWATDLLMQHEAGVTAARRYLETATAALTTARASAEATRTLASRQEKRRTAEAHRRELTAAAGPIDALALVADAAARAAEVAPALRAVGEAAAALDTSRNAAALAVKHAADLIAAATAPEAPAATTPAALRQVAKDQDRHRGALEQLKSLAGEADAEDLAAERALAAAAAARASANAAGVRREELAAQREGLVARREAAVAAAAAWTAADQRARALAAAAEVRPQLARAEHGCIDLTRRQQEAKELELQRRGEYLTVREARIDAMRVELAALLVDDAPCLVCGSLDHPDVPQMSAEQVGMDVEDAAADRFREAEKIATGLAGDLKAASEALGSLQTRWAAVVAELAEFELEPDVVGTTVAAKQAKEQAAVLKRTAATLGEADADLTALDTKLIALAAAIASTEADAAAHDREARAARDRAGARRAELLTQLGESPDLATAVDRAGRLAEAAEAAAAALENVERAGRTLTAAELEARRASAAAGFCTTPGSDGADACGDVAAAGAALREAGWRADAAERIAAHRDACAGNSALLADPELSVDLSRPADAAAAELVERAAHAEHEAALLAQGRAERQVQGLSRTVPALTALLERLPELQHRAHTAKSVSDLTAGQGANSKRMALSAFVLAARLEEIAQVASGHLSRMSEGRYSLIHTDEGRDARKKAGLGLLVLDNWTGKHRDTATLSGGETFEASLALALALADVVCGEAGGTRLESLFVDEGFGSLDETTLDRVMDVLDGLRAGGRAVGIVSHVSELKQRIPNRLHVIKRETGSTVAVSA
ncbi:MAG: AAA family ATPase [Sporichthyaceae bacterium]